MNKVKIGLLMFVIITATAFITFFSSAVFRIETVQIEGLDSLERRIVKEKIKEKDVKQQNIWLLRKKGLAAEITDIKNIQKAQVFKHYPDQLIITIGERTPVAKFYNDGSKIVFDKSGYILKNASIKSGVKIPEIKGISYIFKEEDMIEFPPTLKKIVSALVSYDKFLRKRIRLIENKPGNEDSCHLILKMRSGLKIILGKSDNLDKKFEVLISLLEEIENEDLQVNYIDLRLPEKPALKMKKKDNDEN